MEAEKDHLVEFYRHLQESIIKIVQVLIGLSIKFIRQEF